MTTNVLYALKFTYIRNFQIIVNTKSNIKQEGRNYLSTPPSCKEKSAQFGMSYFLCFFCVNELNKREAIMSL